MNSTRGKKLSHSGRKPPSKCSEENDPKQRSEFNKDWGGGHCAKKEFSGKRKRR